MNTRREPTQLVLDLLGRSRLKVQVAAVLVDRAGRIFAWGWNNGWTHAEEHALVRANPRRVRGSTLIVAARRRGNVVMSRPCGSRCFALARSRGVALVRFRDKGGEWREESCA